MWNYLLYLISMPVCKLNKQPEKGICFFTGCHGIEYSSFGILCGHFKEFAGLIIFFAILFGSCSSPRYFAGTRIADRFLDDPAVVDTHVGIALYDSGMKKYIYTHNSDKFFVPASNTKLATLYAGLKYLGDSIPGIQYSMHNDTIYLFPTGDPTFMLLDFSGQPVLDFLRGAEKPLVMIEPEHKTAALGYGWPWNFYLDYYMPERSPFPIYGNVIIWAQNNMAGLDDDVYVTYVSSYPRHPWPVEIRDGNEMKFEVRRPFNLNDYVVYPGLDDDRELFVPFVTNGMQAAHELLNDTLKKDVGIETAAPAYLKKGLLLPGSGISGFRDAGNHSGISGNPDYSGIVYSRPADSLFRPMMLFSDNFFAEQTLLMISQKLFGVMDEGMLIEYLLENDLADLPQNPRWVDGSGLSRYNLFTPESLVRLLEKMHAEFGSKRLNQLLPTGGEGTLGDYYLDVKGKIYAKTGTLEGNAVALSGYIVTSGGRKLIFSILVNNHNKASDEVRIAIESFLKEIIYRY